MYVIAVEYSGPDLEPGHGSGRMPVTEHAYDVVSGRLAHEDQSTRIGFYDPSRGWPSRPCARRCQACTATVNLAVSGVVASTLIELANWAERLDTPRPDMELRSSMELEVGLTR